MTYVHSFKKEICLKSSVKFYDSQIHKRLKEFNPSY